MAQTIDEIQAQIIASKEAQPDLAGLTSTSKTALWRLWVYIFSVAIWVQQKLNDFAKADITETVSALRPHSLKWYAIKAKAFMYGYNLADNDGDYYDTSELTQTEIETAMIIKQAAVVEVTRGLRIKVAKDNGAGGLTALDTPELDAFKEYMARVKDAGVKLLITSNVADNIKLSLKVYYNPLVLNATGGRIDGSSTTPVQDAVKTFLNTLPFNGVFVAEYLVDALQKVEGVVIPHVVLASARYGVLPYTTFDVTYTPDSGYLEFATGSHLTITFIPQTTI